MPVINAQGFANIASTRVQVDWSDVPAAKYVTVYRVDCLTGERTQLRPYVAYNPFGYLLLSCGMATFWDTEVPLDRCVFYCTQAQDATGDTIMTAVSPVLFDDFNRVNVNTWDGAPSGQSWVNAGGAAADYDVDGSRGTHAIASLVNRNSQITVTTNLTRAQVDTGQNQVSTGDTAFSGVCLGSDANNMYMARLQFRIDGTARLEIIKRVAAVQTSLAGSVTIANYVANQMFTIKMEVYLGSFVRAKSWISTDPEPMAWTLTTGPESSLTSLPGVILRSQQNGGNTNVGLISLFDNLSAGDVCATTQAVEVCSTNVTVASNGNLWLKDPVRPCNDQQISLCWSPSPPCDPNLGIFFARMEEEGYSSQTTNLLPVNAHRPIPVVRQRTDTESTLVLVTKTFTDRDALLTEVEPGSPLLLQVPAAYGVPDRYMSVGNVTISRYQSDHRYQPRVATLPFIAANRTAGPTQGICGARVDDLCDTYATWTALAGSGLSFSDLLDGKASPDGPGVSFRIWSTIEATYATWLAVETAPNTWKTVREG